MTDHRWCWLGVGVLIFYCIVTNIVCILAHQHLAPFDVVTAVMSEDALKEKAYAKRGNQGEPGQVQVNILEVSQPDLGLPKVLSRS